MCKEEEVTKARQVLSMLFAVMLIVSVAGCNSSDSDSSDISSDASSDTSSDSSDESGDSSFSSDDVSSYAVSVAEDADTYDTDDIVDNVTFDFIIYIDFTEYTAQLSSGTPQAITPGGVTLLTTDGTSVTVTQTDYGITVSSTVEATVRYNLSGELDGTLTVDSSSAYLLYLDGVAINATEGPTFDLESEQKVFLVFASDTINTLTDSSDRNEDMEMKAAFYGKGAMVFSGDGELYVTGSYKHGIFSKDYIRVRGGTLDVEVNTRDAVRLYRRNRLGRRHLQRPVPGQPELFLRICRSVFHDIIVERHKDRWSISI